jgi:hypothetical protein
MAYLKKPEVLTISGCNSLTTKSRSYILRFTNLFNVSPEHILKTFGNRSPKANHRLHQIGTMSHNRTKSPRIEICDMVINYGFKTHLTGNWIHLRILIG